MISGLRLPLATQLTSQFCRLGATCAAMAVNRCIKAAPRWLHKLSVGQKVNFSGQLFILFARWY